MERPEQFQLVNDEKLCFSVLRTFCRQRHPQQEQRGLNPRFHMRFAGADDEDAGKSIRVKLSLMFGPDEAPLNIDPEDHQPDEDHVDEEAKERQQRFREEWE